MTNLNSWIVFLCDATLQHQTHFLATLVSYKSFDVASVKDLHTHLDFIIVSFKNHALILFGMLSQKIKFNFFLSAVLVYLYMSFYGVHLTKIHWFDSSRLFVDFPFALFNVLILFASFDDIMLNFLERVAEINFVLLVADIVATAVGDRFVVLALFD